MKITVTLDLNELSSKRLVALAKRHACTPESELEGIIGRCIDHEITEECDYFVGNYNVT